MRDRDLDDVAAADFPLPTLGPRLAAALPAFVERLEHQADALALLPPIRAPLAEAA